MASLRAFRNLAPLAVSLSLALSAAACAGADGDDDEANLTQREGDPAKGRVAILNNGYPNKPYISCGVPYSLWNKVRPATPASDRIGGRIGHNAELPYYLSTAVTSRGVEVVSANCLFCHGGKIEDKVIVGLGDSMRDFTYSGALVGPIQTVVTQAAGFLAGLTRDERAEFDRFRKHMAVTADYVETDTVGMNPAATMFGLFAGFRDPVTLKNREAPEPWMRRWLTTENAALVSDVPSWWTTAKKRRAIYYGGFGVGDHARLMMNASLLCLEDANEARVIDQSFGDIRAFVRSVKPPAFPRAVDMALAARGKYVYEQTCEQCHGSPKKNNYPDAVIALGRVGTDARYNDFMSGEFGQRSMDWFNRSWWGTNGNAARMEMPTSAGYLAPPLDGVWATAPYLHNGSVPTLEALLDSSKRPKYWLRSFDSTDYDYAALGWRFKTLEHGKDHLLNVFVKKKVYDTTRAGFSNAGHTFGDRLTPADRKAVLELLKTF